MTPAAAPLRSCRGAWLRALGPASPDLPSQQQQPPRGRGPGAGAALAARAGISGADWRGGLPLPGGRAGGCRRGVPGSGDKVAGPRGEGGRPAGGRLCPLSPARRPPAPLRQQQQRWEAGKLGGGSGWRRLRSPRRGAPGPEPRAPRRPHAPSACTWGRGSSRPRPPGPGRSGCAGSGSGGRCCRSSWVSSAPSSSSCGACAACSPRQVRACGAAGTCWGCRSGCAPGPSARPLRGSQPPCRPGALPSRGSSARAALRRAEAGAEQPPLAGQTWPAVPGVLLTGAERRASRASPGSPRWQPPAFRVQEARIQGLCPPPPTPSSPDPNKLSASPTCVSPVPPVPL